MIICFDNFELDTDLYQLRCAGEPRPVEPQVFDLLIFLSRHQDRIVSRQELLDTLWADRVVSDTTLSSRIKAARQALGDDGQSQRYIATFNRRGYRFVAPVTLVQTDSVNSATQVMHSNTLAVSQEIGETCLFQQGPGGTSHERPVLAVLPFAHSLDSNQTAWFAEVLGEDISIQLARIPGFIVLSRNTTSQYRQREFSVQQIAEELGVDYLVEGSVWSIGEDFRVGVQLLETQSGNILWSERTVIQGERLFELQEMAVREIVARIEPELNRAELAALRKRRTVDLGAWALYRQGHALLGQKGWSEETFNEVADLLRQAIQQDPQLAFAHAYLALILAIGHLVGLVGGEAWREEAVHAAETAIALDGQDSDVLGYVGCALADMGDVLRGIGMLRRAVELDPSNAQAVAALGAALLQAGEEEGVEYMRQGLRISPRDNRASAWGALLARGLLNFGRVDEAIEVARSACRCDDKIFLPRVVLAIASIAAGDRHTAKTALDDAKRIRPRLSQNDISRFAAPQEMALLQTAGLI